MFKISQFSLYHNILLDSTVQGDSNHWNSPWAETRAKLQAEGTWRRQMAVIVYLFTGHGAVTSGSLPSQVTFTHQFLLKSFPENSSDSPGPDRLKAG